MSDNNNSNMTDSEYWKCHGIIHAAAVAAGGVGAGLAQIPLSDNLVIMPIQVGMVGSLAAVFDKSLSEAAIKGLIAAAAATVVGRNLAGALVGWIPGIGNAIQASTAFTITETIGWTIANNFADGKREEEKAEEAAKEAERRKAEEEAAKEAERVKREKEAAKEAEPKRKEEATREPDRIMRKHIMRTKKAEPKRKEEATREPDRIKCFGRAKLAELRHKEEERLKTVEEAPQESVTAPVQNVPVQNVSPRKASRIITMMKKVWEPVRDYVWRPIRDYIWRPIRIFVDVLINFIKNLAALVIIAQIVLFVLDKASLIPPEYQSVLSLAREILDLIRP